MMSSPQDIAPIAPRLEDALRDKARALGFDQVGICPAVSPPGLARLHEWLGRGYAGEMAYFESRREAYAHPDGVLSGARSIVMLSVPYAETIRSHAENVKAGQGRVARYASGAADYHHIIHGWLEQLANWLFEQRPQCRCRGVVDSAPLMEHEYAQLAGLGWIGKNTLLLNRDRGSYFFLAALLTDLELQYDQPHTMDHCGSCRACLDACPTQAFPEAYVLDATRCISYLTIEQRGPIPEPLRADVGDWVFGCDICQEVCPWNRATRTQRPIVPEFERQLDLDPLDLVDLFWMEEAAFRVRFRHTPLWRAKRAGLLRNAANVLGNQHAIEAESALIHGLHDNEPLVRAACAMALGQLATPSSGRALMSRKAVETTASVQQAIQHAIDNRPTAGE